MKKLKSKMLLLTMLTIGLWSCEKEEVEQETVAITKAPELVSTETNYDYKFATTNYYHLDKLLNDTIQIKKMYSNAKTVVIDGNRIDMYVTDQEAKIMNDKIDLLKQNNTQLQKEVGNNMMVYKYETRYYDNLADFRIRRNFRLSRHITLRNNISDYSNYQCPVTNENKNFLYTYYLAFTDWGSPNPVWKPAPFGGWFRESELSDARNKKLSFSVTILPHNLNLTPLNNISFLINLKNNSRYRSSVIFTSKYNQLMVVMFNPGQAIEMGGWTNYTGYAFNGKSFIINKHEAIIVP
jgi:hypothetical protein